MEEILTLLLVVVIQVLPFVLLLLVIQMVGSAKKGPRSTHVGEMWVWGEDHFALAVELHEIRARSLIVQVIFEREHHDEFREKLEILTIPEEGAEESYFDVFPSPSYPWKGLCFRVVGSREGNRVTFYPWVKGKPRPQIVGPANFGT